MQKWGHEVHLLQVSEGLGRDERKAGEVVVNLIEGAQTVCNLRRDFPEWHLGRSPYVFWALDVDFPVVRVQVAQATDHLARWLLAGYCRQPHVTLDLCGFPAAVPIRDDEFSSDLLERQCAALSRAKIPAFDIEIGGLGSFSSAPFLGIVDAQGRLADVRRCLAVDGLVRLHGDYVPHVTVGLYGGAWPAAEVGAGLSSFLAGKPVICRIERISLMAYQPSEVGGPLSCLADYWLASGELRWQGKLFV